MHTTTIVMTRRLLLDTILSAGEYRLLLALQLFGVLVRRSLFVVRSSLAVKHENEKRMCMIFVLREYRIQ